MKPTPHASCSRLGSNSRRPWETARPVLKVFRRFGVEAPAVRVCRHGLAPSGLKRVALPSGVRSGHASPLPVFCAPPWAHGTSYSATRGAGRRPSIEPHPMRSPHLPDRTGIAAQKSGAAARAAVSPLFYGHRRERPAAGRCRRWPVATNARNKGQIADLFCSAKVNCGQSQASAHFSERMVGLRTSGADGTASIETDCFVRVATKAMGRDHRQITPHAPQLARMLHAHSCYAINLA
jgi:hypothetical protein